MAVSRMNVACSAVSDADHAWLSAAETGAASNKQSNNNGTLAARCLMFIVSGPLVEVALLKAESDSGPVIGIDRVHFDAEP